MTIGILASRYAKALYGFASDSGQETTVYKEMKFLMYQLLSVPELRRYLNNPMMNADSKIELLATAAGGAICTASERFFRFIMERDKFEYLLYMVVAYQNVYRKAKHIVLVQFVSAQEVDEATLKQIKEIISKGYDTDISIELETQVNPSLIGGFRLTVEDRQLDASVSGELKRMRKALL